MLDAYYPEFVVQERIRGYFQIVEQERLMRLAEGSDRRRRFRPFQEWIAYVGRVLAAWHGAEPNPLRRA